VTATDETRVHHPPRVRWGVVCGDGDVVWARDEAAARRLLASLIGAIRIVCEEAPGAVQPPAGSPAGTGEPVTERGPRPVPVTPAQRTAHPHPR